MKKKLLLLSLMIAAALTASATVIKTIGQGGGSYDYASLYAASLDLKANPLTENTVWEICTDLTETMNTGLYNNTEYSLTIRPNAAEKRTVNYMTANDNYGPSGHMVIGGIPEDEDSDDSNTTFNNLDNIRWTAGITKNLIIDGQYNGDGERHLVFTEGNKDIGGITMVFYGNVTSTSVKNCEIYYDRASSKNYAVVFRTEKSTDNHPNGVTMENCIITCNNAGATENYSVHFNTANKLTVAGYPENITFRGCEFVCDMRGVMLNGAKDINFEGCTFRMRNCKGGYLTHGIYGYALKGTVNVKGCKFLELKSNNISSGAYGIQAITASGGADIWNIDNNIFTGLDFLKTGVAGKNAQLCAVRCVDSCVVRHNTFVMPTLSNAPATALVTSQAVCLLWLVSAKNYIVQNNIFVSHEATAYNSLIRGALNPNCQHNVFYHDGGNAAAVAGAAIVTDEAALAAAEPTSKWKEVEFNPDMSIADASLGDYDLAVAKIDGIDTDINGKTRLNPTYAGAEAPTILVNNLYKIDNNGFDWNPTVGTVMTKVGNNVFKKTLDFGANSYFSFSTVLAADNNEGGRSYVDGYRFASDEENKVLADGSNVALVKINRAVKIEEAGSYIITVDFNNMTIDVEKVLSMFYNPGGLWNYETGIDMTKVSDNIYSAEATFEGGELITFSSRHGSWDNINTDRFNITSDGDYWLISEQMTPAFTRQNSDANVKNLFVPTYNPGRYRFTVNCSAKTIAIEHLSTTITIGETGYATYYSALGAYTMPDGLTGYVFSTELDPCLTEAYAAGDVVPAGVGLVLEGVAGTYDLVFTTGGSAPAENQLHGSDGQAMTYDVVSGDFKYYGLSLAAEPNNTLTSVGFYYMADGGAAFLNGGHKAFLAVPQGSSAPQAFYLFNGENNATELNNVEGADEVLKFMRNGQLYILRDGVTYDALGRIVK